MKESKTCPLLVCAAVLLLLAPLCNAQCSNFNTVSEAQADCTGTFEPYPVNGTQLPYKCSTCGSGLICPGGTCPPVAASAEDFLSNTCPQTYSSASEDFSCAALQRHCEDMGQGYLMYAKVFFFASGSRFACSNCQGFDNVEINGTFEEVPPGTEVDPGIISPFPLGLLVVAVLMFFAGFVMEYKGRKMQDGNVSSTSVGLSICDWEMKRLFGHIDSHGRSRSLRNLLWKEAILIRYIWKLCCCCCREKKQAKASVTGLDDRELEADRLFDTTFLVVAVFIGLGIAYLLNGLTPVQIKCELSYSGLGTIIGVADTSRLDPFRGSPPLLVPEKSKEVYPRVIENQRHLLTLFEQIEGEQNVIGTALTTNILTEELTLIVVLVCVEKFLRGCEEMKHWSMETLTKIHIVVRGITILYAAAAIATQYFRMKVSITDGILLVGSNFFFVIMLLTVFLPAIGFVRWMIGSCVLSLFGQQVEGATCCGSNANALHVQRVDYKEAEIPFAQPTYPKSLADSGRVSL